METNPKNKIMKDISGLLLCAGLSGRMGTSKALMLYDELPFAVLIIKKLLLVCSEVSVVTGHESKKVETGIKNYLKVDEISKVKFVFNDNYKTGMFSSLQCGLRHISQSDWILYHFVDQPFIPESFYKEFACQLSGEMNWLQPSYSNKLGHPILFDNKVASYVLELNGNSSLRHFSNDKRIKRRIWECNYSEVLTDVDTLEQFNNLTIKQ